jgi:cell division inhibitor SepF
MAGFFKKALDYLGLDDDEYQDYDPYEDQQQPAARRVAAPAQDTPAAPSMVYPRHQTSGAALGASGIAVVAQSSSDSGVAAVAAQPRAASPAVRTITPTRSNKVHVCVPDGFGEAQDIGERFRSGQIVLIDLRETDREAAKRLVDFASGLAFGLNGEIKKTEDRVFMLRPQSVDVEMRRLRDTGLMR